jgi:hypothetical protein
VTSTTSGSTGVTTTTAYVAPTTQVTTTTVCYTSPSGQFLGCN